MTATTQFHTESRFSRIMQSHNALPNWVKIWMNFILGPVNLATLAFLSEPSGALIAALAIGGMFLTVAIVFASGEFTKAAGIGHVVAWTPLIFMLTFARPEGSAIYQTFLTVLLVINVIALAFDYNDVRIWIQSKMRG
ncbi:MAG: hypothetical protein AAF468_18975 [Pseudomonadota bacterium]